ncbi:alanine racemase [Roseivivax sp. GX 12232]|uniref:alanine racemase n=1 Tax=Roseivivax sp. GX 12232 TaxID=2900547 RepID=UPI001E319BD5|nr:alanine racemase [Roseivivax sp. GX 12232]MCE0505872.1 alanine racemase [Roseivivax sp. GX 12232]
MRSDGAISLPDAWVEIDLDALAANLAAIKARLPAGCDYCAVVKSDAYGHGIDRVAPVLAEGGVSWAGITSNQDALALRRAGFTGRIMRLRGASLAEARDVAGLGVEELATSAEAARALSDPDAPVPVHLPLNAGGMGRDGIELAAEGGRAAAREILAMPGLRIAGLTTHFPAHDPEDLAASRARFEADVAWCLAEGGLSRDAVTVHAASSLGLLAEAGIEYDMLRAGAILWGIVGARAEFTDVMRLCARITSVNTLPEGASIGYDRAHVLGRESRIANLSIGYANGIRRSMANSAQVAVRGRLAPLIGKISMNALTVDVTDIPEAAPGDTVTLFGADGAARVTRAMVEEASGTIMADLYCDWGRSNRRQYSGGPPQAAAKNRTR